jgi:hypothetical protein
LTKRTISQKGQRKKKFPSTTASRKKGPKLSKKGQELLEIQNDHMIINTTRRNIHQKVIETSKNIHYGNFEIIEPLDIELMFHLYDNKFFHDFFSKNLKDKLDLKISKKMTRAAGKTTKHLKKRIYTITLSSILLAQSFKGEDREITVNGVECKDRLDAAMRIMEHEMLHLLEFKLFNRSNCSRPRFKKLGYNFFGHTDTKHKLVTKYEINSKEHDLKPGDIVKFEYRGKSLNGTISRITKRATVLVEDQKGTFKDFNGKRCLKFYIPLLHLEPVPINQIQ